MSFGKMNSFIDIISIENVIDEEGFSEKVENVVASVRAYKEDRHGTQKWANMAAFSEATTLFRFRKIPDVNITTKLYILHEGIRYDIVSVENVRERGMYIEVMAKKVEPAC
nr:MAG TPA: Putative head tail adaptor [Caudoviricetes sp.]